MSEPTAMSGLRALPRQLNAKLTCLIELEDTEIRFKGDASAQARYHKKAIEEIKRAADDIYTAMEKDEAKKNEEAKEAPDPDGEPGSWAE